MPGRSALRHLGQQRDEAADIHVDLKKFEADDFDIEEDLDEIRELEDIAPLVMHKRLSGLRLDKQTSSIMRGGLLNNLGAAPLSGETQDLIAESISVMLEKSHNIRQLFYNLEVALLKILGKHCTAVHFMVVDEEFLREIKLFDRLQNQFKTRKLTVGPDFADLVRLERPPPAPHKTRKRTKISKDEREAQKEAEEAQFLSFLPEFTNLEKVTQNAVVKSSCIVYPMFNLKKAVGGAAPHNNCKIII